MLFLPTPVSTWPVASLTAFRRSTGHTPQSGAGLRVALAGRFGDGRQRLAFDLEKHSNMQLFEVFKTPHIREEVLIELALFIDEGHGRSRWSRVGHYFSSLSQLNDNAPFSFVYPGLTEEGPTQPCKIGLCWRMAKLTE